MKKLIFFVVICLSSLNFGSGSSKSAVNQNPATPPRQNVGFMMIQSLRTPKKQPKPAQQLPVSKSAENEIARPLF